MRALLTSLTLFSLIFSACKVGPNYKRPDLAPPAQVRSDPQPSPVSLADQKWFELFKDEKLVALIKEALTKNYDVRIASARVLEARGILTSTSSGLWPNLNGQATANRQGGTGAGVTSYSAGGQVIWDIDLWGQLRRASEAARADILNTEAVQLGVLQSVVTETAGGYFTLLALDESLRSARGALKAREESLRLVSARLQGGVASKLEEDQARSLVATAASTVAQLERDTEQTENALSLLLGRNPGPIERAGLLDPARLPTQVPAGLPSALLERRPDVRAAEQALVAANARIGVAKAAFFPSLSLTGGGGWQSFELSRIISTTASGGVYNYGAALNVPIFDAGRRIGDYRSAKARYEVALASYQKAVGNAFRDTSDSLIGLQKAREIRAQQQIFADTLRDQSRLSNLRYRGGVSSYLEVLDTERQLLDAEQALFAAQRDEYVAFLQLYKALGGAY
jgi:multidrug efflux system outer membrane protein